MSIRKRVVPVSSWTVVLEWRFIAELAEVVTDVALHLLFVDGGQQCPDQLHTLCRYTRQPAARQEVAGHAVQKLVQLMLAE